jgi:predicted RNA-binding protein with PUA-like domain
MTTNHWLVKQEPEDYSWSDFAKDGHAAWTGVRNYGARNNLRAMQKGDEVLFYHSGDEKAVVGLARVRRTAFRDPTAEEGDWVAVELEAVRPLARTMTLAEIKANPALKDIALVRNSRLSVMPLKPAEFKILCGK